MDLCPRCGSDRLAFAHGQMEHDGMLVLNGPYFICQRCGWEEACPMGWAPRFVPPRPLASPRRPTAPKPAAPPSPLYLRALAVHMHFAAPQSALGDHRRRRAPRWLSRLTDGLVWICITLVAMVILFAFHGSFND